MTVYVHGRRVVDLWGGLADPRTGRPWTATTPAVVFSCTKGVLAVATYLLVQDGRLELDAPVARYWPEFAEHGKAMITVRSLLTHRAGLPALDRSSDPGRGPGLGPGHRCHRGPGPPLATRDRARVPRASPTAGSWARSSAASAASPSARSCGDGWPNRCGLRLWVGLPPEERDARRLAAGAASRHRPRGCPRHPEARAQPDRRPQPHDGRRVRLPGGRRPRHLQRPRHPGGRDPGRQRHRRRTLTGAALRRLRLPDRRTCGS